MRLLPRRSGPRLRRPADAGGPGLPLAPAGSGGRASANEPPAIDAAPTRGPRPAVRPVLFLLVYGVLLVVVGVTAAAQAALVSADSWTSTLNSTVAADTALVRSFLSLNLRSTDLEPGGPSADRAAALDQALAALRSNGGVVRVAILRPDGTVIASDVDGLGQANTASGLAFSHAVEARAVDASLVGVGPEDILGRAPPGASALIREYLPVLSGDRVYAVIGLWRDAGPILAGLDRSRWTIVLITLSGAVVVAAVLFFLFRSAQRRITQQTLALVDADRRDPLTGEFNHGTLVAELARRIEMRQTGDVVGVALIDVDGFRGLNDTHGHAAGDRALVEVARAIRAVAPPGSLLGRYGPDEFLLVGGEPGSLEPAVQRLRAALAGVSLQFGSSEPLPLTVSAGLCAAPRDAESVTNLLSVAAVTVGEARSSGGNEVRVAARPSMASAYARTFDVLQGLVIAVDSKDRYTNRHSDDVARYADFLAGRLGLSLEVRRPLHLAGLLHDVGKIGIPDVILRKPARLSAAEFAVIKQHVALGDMIVRDLPDIELVRAGIRYHHERWDGRGYLEGLAGEEIPLIPRILAVADAFSAMTTDRPYRKALPREEALARLEDAAGSQLDERLVVAFVAAIRETDGRATLDVPALHASWADDKVA